MKPQVSAFFDDQTFSVSYVVADAVTRRCAVIDSVRDFDAASGRTSTASADLIVAHVREHRLTVDWILETHVHADHLSAAPYLREALGGQIVIGDQIGAIQGFFGKLFNAEAGFSTDGRQFDRLLADGDTLAIGELQLTAISTPGHTPACMTYVIDDCAFVGDTLFMPDFGTARTDFPGGDAATLYRSIQKIFALPPHTRLFMCHDYLSSERQDYRWETTVAEQKSANIHINDGVTEEAFIRLRTGRDATLPMPTLLLPSVQVNMRAGALPPADDNGMRYLKLPIDAL